MHALNHAAVLTGLSVDESQRMQDLRAVCSLFPRHFSKSKMRRDTDTPWGPGVQAVPAPHGPAQNQPPPGHPLNPTNRPTRTLVRKKQGGPGISKHIYLKSSEK